MGFRISICLFAISLFSCATAQDKTDKINGFSNEKKYAVAYCLSNSYLNSDFSLDSKYIAGSYLQKGSSGIHVYESIRNYVMEYTKKPYISKHEKNLNIMECIDLYDSMVLLEVIKQSVNKIN